MSATAGAEWLEPVTVNKSGTRCVVETNWHDTRTRCQMIWERVETGGVVITTCRPEIPAVVASRLDLAELARAVYDGGPADGSSIELGNYPDGSALLSIDGGNPIWLTRHQRDVLAYWLRNGNG